MGNELGLSHFSLLSFHSKRIVDLIFFFGGGRLRFSGICGSEMQEKMIVAKMLQKIQKPSAVGFVSLNLITISSL